MRHGRAKQIRKTLQFFQRTTGLKAPFGIVVDGPFVVAVLRNKIPIDERLDRLLQHGKFELYMTQSSLVELKSLSEAAGSTEQQRALLGEAHAWASQHCAVLADIPQARAKLTRALSEQVQHGKKKRKSKGAPPSPFDDLTLAQGDLLRLVTAAFDASVDATHPSPKETRHKAVESSRLYLVASQDEMILDVLRLHFPVPLIRLSRTVLLLEQPSKAVQGAALISEDQKWNLASSVNAHEERLVELVRKQNQTEQEQRQQATKRSREERQEQHLNRKRKIRAKGPNPLSCKKKKASASM